MAKDKLTDYSATNASNTDVGGVNINEGMLPSDVNNAIREVMTHLKDFAEGTEAVNSLAVDNININGNTISSTDTNGNINITPNGSGAVAFTTNATFGDNDEAIFGAGTDLRIYHNASNGNSHITESGSGSLVINGDNLYLQNTAGTENYIAAISNDAVTLYHDNSAKLYTQSHGARVDGGLRFASSGAATDTSNPYIFRSSGADNMVFATGSAERMRITSDGNVGIGTSAPAHNVEIVATAAGSVNDSLQIRNNATSSGTGSRIRFINSTDNTSDTNGASISSVRNGDDNDLVFETENATRMTIDHAGNVGISNTAPDFNLSVGNSSSVNPSIQIMSASNSNAQLLFGDGAGAAGYRGTIVYSNATDSMSFSTAGAERMRLDGSSGNLLLGTTSSTIYSGTTTGINLNPNGATSFNRASGQAAMFNRTTSDGDIVQFRKDGTTVGVIGTVGGDMVAGTGDTGLRFHDGADQVYPSNTNGSGRDAAIDLGNSGARFKDGYFNGTLYAGRFAGKSDTNTYIDFQGSDVMQFITGGGERGRFSATGNLLLGQTSTDTPGTGNTTTGTSLRGLGDGFFSRSNGEALYLNRNNDGGMISIRRSNSQVGVISVTTSGTTYNTTSDRRLKQDIEPLQATDKLMQMNPVSYNWKSDPDGPRSMGFIAQEMQEVMPEAVSTGDDDMMSMDYGRITPILVSALQDAHRKIEQLEQRIADMEAK